nr:SHOCT domain-containing protein [Ilumatobacter nonamiensis]
MARTAVIAGTATAVSNRVSRRQANRWTQQAEPQYAQQPQYAPEPHYAPEPQAPATQSSVPIEQLKQLADLMEQGILTKEEFAAQKAKLLGT